MLAAPAAAGHTAQIKPWLARSWVPVGFTAADFALDEAAAR